jgi:hypothetical protein
VSVDLRGDGLLVRRDVAQQQMDVPISPGGSPAPTGPQPGGAPIVPGPDTPAPELPQRKRRFFGVVTVDSTRPGCIFRQLSPVWKIGTASPDPR